MEIAIGSILKIILLVLAFIVILMLLNLISGGSINIFNKILTTH